MRAFAVRTFGEPASVHDLPVPAADGAFLLRVRFAGVNPLDINLLGRLTAASSYPFVVGIDFAGVAERVPAGEHGVRGGDRVFGMARTHGSYAEYAAVAPAARMEPVARIPDGVADDQAAALPIPAVTALRTVDLLEVTAGQHVVVMGATFPGDVVSGELVEGGQRGGEFRWCVGPVRRHQRAQDVIVDLGVEVGEQQPVASQGVAVAAGDALDEAVSGQPG